MNFYINKSELESLNTLEEEIDKAWNISSYSKENCKSIIIGHDLRAEHEQIETLLKAASQKTAALKALYEKELKNK
jgi:hypothetical protein